MENEKKDFFILAINPGSTSMKLAIYNGEERIKYASYSYTCEELAPYHAIFEQVSLRLRTLECFLATSQFDLHKLSAVVGRGGLVTPLKSGAYYINELMLDRLEHRPLGNHASNLGAKLAWEIAKPLGIPALVYDGVTVDELQPLARLTGVKGVVRTSRMHALNMRAVAMRAAKDMNKEYSECNIITAHMGGGITIAIHSKGHMVDMVGSYEGALTPERAGRVFRPGYIQKLIRENTPYQDISRQLVGKTGLISLLGTNDAREVERRIEQGDEYARFVYETMAYQVAKSIAELSVVTYGKIDKIVLTGSLAYSKQFTDWVLERISFLAEIALYPGEDELFALSMGALRVLRKEECAYVYDDATDGYDEEKLAEDSFQEYTKAMKATVGAERDNE